MPCRERFTDTHDSVAVANSGAFGKRCERQGVCDALGVYVAQRVVEIKERSDLRESHRGIHTTRVQSVALI
jgi:hypothetical protein